MRTEPTACSATAVKITGSTVNIISVTVTQKKQV